MSRDGELPPPVAATRRGIPTLPMPSANSTAVSLIAA